jgi:hypothetical protein
MKQAILTKDPIASLAETLLHAMVIHSGTAMPSAAIDLAEAYHAEAVKRGHIEIKETNE